MLCNTVHSLIKLTYKILAGYMFRGDQNSHLILNCFNILGLCKINWKYWKQFLLTIKFLQCTISFIPKSMVTWIMHLKYLQDWLAAAELADASACILAVASLLVWITVAALRLLRFHLFHTHFLGFRPKIKKKNYFRKNVYVNFENHPMNIPKWN